jgi:hypothetical protein
MGFLEWLENTPLAVFIREYDSIWAYPTILFLHTLGLGAVAGFSTFLDLRVLGFARGLPFSDLRPFTTAVWIAFALAAVSGTALFIANAVSKAHSPVFLIKLVFVGLAIATHYVMTKRIFRNPLAEQSPLSRGARVLAVASIAFWVGATTAGRLLAYLG